MRKGLLMHAHWNTGALYTKHGQRMTALVDADHTVVRFADHDRGIFGKIPAPNPHLLDTKRRVREYVEFAYLRNHYLMDLTVTKLSYHDQVVSGGPGFPTPPGQ